MAQFLTHIDYLNRRQAITVRVRCRNGCPAVITRLAYDDALRQLEEPVCSLLCPCVGQDVGCGAADQQRRAGELREFCSGIPGMVAWLDVLFVAGIVFLVDDDQAEIGYRCEQGRACANYHREMPRADLPPLIVALTRR